MWRSLAQWNFIRQGARSSDIATVISPISVEVTSSPAEEIAESKEPAVIFANTSCGQETKKKAPTKSKGKEKITNVPPKKKKLFLSLSPKASLLKLLCCAHTKSSETRRILSQKVLETMPSQEKILAFV